MLLVHKRNYLIHSVALGVPPIWTMATFAAVCSFTDRCFGIAQEVTALPVRHLPSPRVNRFYKNNSGPGSRKARKLSQQVRCPCTKCPNRRGSHSNMTQPNIIHTAHKPYTPCHRFCSPPKQNLHPNPNRSLTTYNPEWPIAWTAPRGMGFKRFNSRWINSPLELIECSVSVPQHK